MRRSVELLLSQQKREGGFWVASGREGRRGISPRWLDGGKHGALAPGGLPSCGVRGA